MNYSIIIPSYNGRRYPGTCFSSLVPQIKDVSNIIMVDNCSTDGSSDYMKNAWPGITILQQKTNTGFQAQTKREVIGVAGKASPQK